MAILSLKSKQIFVCFALNNFILVPWGMLHDAEEGSRKNKSGNTEPQTQQRHRQRHLSTTNKTKTTTDSSGTHQTWKATKSVQSKVIR